LPALVYGIAPIQDTVAIILEHGHEVQLHIHTEWLEWAMQGPFAGRVGRNIADFTLEEQVALLAVARALLVEAGAPAPDAFRAGNFGASDDTLRALAKIGMVWDSSYNAAWVGNPCAISLQSNAIAPKALVGVTEIPVSGIEDRPGGFRPAQICALSAQEMRDGLYHAAAHDHPAFMIVTHSFEMLSRDRRRPNYTVIRRFEAMCDAIAAQPKLQTSRFSDCTPDTLIAPSKELCRLAPNRWRTAKRMAEQLFSTWVYERQVRPV
jgi:hypothetical protein